MGRFCAHFISYRIELSFPTVAENLIPIGGNSLGTGPRVKTKIETKTEQHPKKRWSRLRRPASGAFLPDLRARPFSQKGEFEVFGRNPLRFGREAEILAQSWASKCMEMHYFEVYNVANWLVKFENNMINLKNNKCRFNWSIIESNQVKIDQVIRSQKWRNRGFGL